MTHFPPRLLLTLATALSTPAAALDAGQTAAIDRIAATAPAGTAVATVMARHYAVLLWVDDYCDGRSVESVRAYVMKLGAGSPAAFETAWAEASSMLSTADPKAMCALALAQYGPDGALIKGGWSPK